MSQLHPSGPNQRKQEVFSLSAVCRLCQSRARIGPGRRRVDQCREFYTMISLGELSDSAWLSCVSGRD